MKRQIKCLQVILKDVNQGFACLNSHTIQHIISLYKRYSNFKCLWYVRKFDSLTIPYVKVLLIDKRKILNISQKGVESVCVIHKCYSLSMPQFYKVVLRKFGFNTYHYKIRFFVISYTKSKIKLPLHIIISYTDQLSKC